MKNLMLQLSRALAVCVLLVCQTAQAEDDSWSEAELDQMLAPIALYPDTVLTHVLIAATYPLEVVQAARWVEDNPKLSGEDAVRAAENEGWDPSVKALVAFPQLLQRLSTDLDWTQQLGEAFLADETQVLASIQTLRQKAYANGSLNDNKHVVVEREREVIVIEPARREVVYVPVYNTRVVYGDWWWPSHPPVYWHTAGVYYRNSPFHWGVSVNVRPWFYFGIFDWQRHHVIVHHHYYHKPPRYYPKRHKHYADARRWQHDTTHRRGVHYRHNRLNRDYNAGYGYRQPTRETQGKQVRHTRVDSNVSVRESKQLYQRKTAEQVRLPNRERPLSDKTPRQHNEALRQQRSIAPEQRLRSTEVNRDERRQQLQQQLKQPAVQHQGDTVVQQRQRVTSTEQLRQRHTIGEAQPKQYQQPAVQQRRQPEPQRAQVQQRQTTPVQQRQQAQPAREYRQPAARTTTVQRSERPRQID
ncbi:DUF3300 domain-containing protein [Rheinheimera sp. YQF-2]|uniref:DUF3300 domain-containing protein n=1 Tax=Rheinheimera lutimaris TaxID=2740584 RepID=A0A7Y5AMS0_9GAMM|nr:DUF3300 domain-containing protein [Rheinheimera lutimaris]NRQ41260.1 DUF3300 domain-containing protein [Rheinheimera lutimaris]